MDTFIAACATQQEGIEKKNTENAEPQTKTPFINTIDLHEDGNTYYGPIANKALFNKQMEKQLREIQSFLKDSKDNKYLVYEYIKGPEMPYFVCRAGQPTKEGALKYMD